mmetsp:Transcript_37666/g.80438  ORF Transcript_37666/g.80438 Transcript_37666/m.80438 type:complete len:193 (+) Transcript_37666:148-726(+)
MSRGGGFAFFLYYLCTILSCNANELTAFDHVRIFASFVITFNVILFVYAKYHIETITSDEHDGPVRAEEIFIAVIHVLGVLSGAWIFIWYLAESVVSRGLSAKRILSPPVLVAGLHALAWYILMFYLIATLNEYWYFLMVPVVIDTSFAYFVYIFKVELLNTSVIGTAEEPLAADERVDNEEKMGSSTVEIV